MIDDATSLAYARFVEHDSSEENLRVLWGYLEGWGRPVAFYTDKSSLFTVNPPALEAADEAVKEELTQIGRALRELGSSGSRRTRRKPRVASSASLGRPRTGW